MTRLKVVYVTSSRYKVEENESFRRVCEMDGSSVEEQFEFEIRSVPILETLEIDLRALVLAEATKAYSKIRVPCVVEHAGLVFSDYAKDSYPGGLTKPMWNALGDRFLQETQSAGRSALARAVVAYCDGLTVRTFVGETKGKLADHPKGKRGFYWDTVFIPEDPNGGAVDLTYAEIAEDPRLGLDYKMKYLSQSSRAMLSFLEFYKKEGTAKLWVNV